MTAAGPALIWCPFASEDEAASVAGALLDERLVACANILAPMRSLFVLDGRRHEAREVGALFKTEGALLEQACTRLAQLHSYDTPAVIGWHADAAPAATRGWLARLLETEHSA